MRKFLCFAIVLVCLLTPCVFAMKFTDVPEDAWYYEDVKSAVEMGFINGKTPTLYKPDDYITRAEVTKLTACIHQYVVEGKVTLKSATGKEWYEPYVTYAQDNYIGIVSKLDSYATRDVFMNVFAKAIPDHYELDYRAINDIPDGTIPDAPEYYGNDAVYKLYRAGIVQGVDENLSCAPDEYIKRSEVAAIITRLMNPDKRIKINKPWVNTGGKPKEGKEYSIGNAGSLPEIPGKTRPTLDKNLSYSENLSALNGYIGGIYNVRMFADGLSLNDLEKGRFAKIVVDSGRYGIEVFQWRKGYEPDYATNSELNAVMEAMYFICGDREVAYALWSWIDAKNINGRANSDDFGFRDVYWNNGSGIITMNGINIEVDNSTPGVSVYYFSN